MRASFYISPGLGFLYCILFSAHTFAEVYQEASLYQPNDYSKRMTNECCNQFMRHSSDGIPKIISFPSVDQVVVEATTEAREINPYSRELQHDFVVSKREAKHTRRARPSSARNSISFVEKRAVTHGAKPRLDRSPSLPLRSCTICSSPPTKPRRRGSSCCLSDLVPRRPQRRVSRKDIEEFLQAKAA